MKVRLIACKDGEELYDLTIGNVYEGSIEWDGTFIVDSDDQGDQNELFHGEYEVVSE